MGHSARVSGCERERKPAFLSLALLLSGSFSALAYDLAVQPVVSPPGRAVDLPVAFASRESSVAALVFEVEYDSSKLEFDPQTSKTVADFSIGGHSANLFAPSSSDGRIGVSIYDPQAPIASLPNGTVITLRFLVRPEASGFASVRIVSSPAPDAADAAEVKVAEWNPLAERTGVFIAASQARLSAAPAVISFGTVSSGHAVKRDLYLFNSGNTETKIESVRLDPAGGPFALAVEPQFPLTVRPNGFRSLPLQFQHLGVGRHTGRLTVESSEQSVEVPLSASVVEDGKFSYDSRFLVPAAARLAGAGGSRWLTSLALVNPSPDRVSALVTLVPASGPRMTQEIQMSAGESRYFSDVAMELFGESEISGSLIVDCSNPDLVLRSTTVNEGPDGGVLGQAVPVVAWENLFHSGQVAYLAGLEHSEMRDTSVTLLNLSEIPVALKVTVTGEAMVGGVRTYVLEPGEIARGIDVFSALEAHGHNLVVRVEALSQDAIFFAYASTMDRRTGGPVFQSAR